jgi:hypothetical protein
MASKNKSIKRIDVAGNQSVVEFTYVAERYLFWKWWQEVGYLDFKAWCKVIEEEANGHSDTG